MSLPEQTPRSERPLLVVFHCGAFFLNFAVFMMSIANKELVDHFDQMGENFIRNMLIFMGISFVGYLGLWNMRRFSVILLLLVGIPFCWYGFHVAHDVRVLQELDSKVALVNFLPILASITCLPMWPVLKTP